MKLSKNLPAAAWLALSLSGLNTGPVQADPVHKALSDSEKNIGHEHHTQEKIDRLNEDTHSMLGEYQALGRELDGLNVYNDQMQRLVDSQTREQALVERQISEIDFTRQQIVPLMLRMIEQLERFVADDQPFLLEERTQRIAQLRNAMDRADVTLAEKYRRILEAYQIELDYSRTLEAYPQEIDRDGTQRTVDVLRIGRIGLYYQTLDQQSAAYWDNDEKTWIAATAAHRRAIQRGLRIASQQRAPQLIELPVAAAVPSDE